MASWGTLRQLPQCRLRVPSADHFLTELLLKALPLHDLAPERRVQASWWRVPAAKTLVASGMPLPSSRGGYSRLRLSSEENLDLAEEAVEAGFCVIDLHGDYADHTLERTKASGCPYVYLNPADHPIPYNPLEVSDPALLYATTDSIVSSIEKIWHASVGVHPLGSVGGGGLPRIADPTLTKSLRRTKSLGSTLRFAYGSNSRSTDCWG